MEAKRAYGKYPAHYYILLRRLRRRRRRWSQRRCQHSAFICFAFPLSLSRSGSMAARHAPHGRNSYHILICLQLFFALHRARFDGTNCSCVYIALIRVFACACDDTHEHSTSHGIKKKNMTLCVRRGSLLIHSRLFGGCDARDDRSGREINSIYAD